MSNYTGLKCRTCNVDCGGSLNHGEAVWSNAWRLREHLFAILNDRENWAIEVKILGCYRGELSFITEHKDHDVTLMDEYGRELPWTEPPTNERR